MINDNQRINENMCLAVIKEEYKYMKMKEIDVNTSNLKIYKLLEDDLQDQGSGISVQDVFQEDNLQDLLQDDYQYEYKINTMMHGRISNDTDKA